MAIFVSYCSVDPKLVKGLLAQLAKLKREVYTETKSVTGEVAWSLIFETIQACDVFILALTTHVLLSEARRFEYQFAVALHKPILVVALDAIPENVTEDGKLDYINVSQALDLRELDDASSTSLADALAKLPPAEPIPSPAPALPDWMPPLSSLKQMIQQPRIPFKEQGKLVLNLREYLERKETTKTAAELLRVLTKHSGRSVDTAHEITLILEELDQVEHKAGGGQTGTRVAIALIALFAILVLGIILFKGIPSLNSQSTTAVTSTPTTNVGAGTVSATTTPTVAPQTTLTAGTPAPTNQQTQMAVASELAVIATQAEATLHAVTGTLTPTATPTP